MLGAVQPPRSLLPSTLAIAQPPRSPLPSTGARDVKMFAQTTPPEPDDPSVSSLKQQTNPLTFPPVWSFKKKVGYTVTLVSFLGLWVNMFPITGDYFLLFWFQLVICGWFLWIVWTF
jgi:hypothetical protein